jgi:hypothetical protein
MPRPKKYMTKRRRHEHQLRSDAARRAWVTIRANREKAKRGKTAA